MVDDMISLLIITLSQKYLFSLFNSPNLIILAETMKTSMDGGISIKENFRNKFTRYINMEVLLVGKGQETLLSN